MRESVKKLIEVLNANPQGCNQYGCKRGMGQSSPDAGRRRSTSMTGRPSLYARYAVSHDKRAAEFQKELDTGKQRPGAVRLTPGELKKMVAYHKAASAAYRATAVGSKNAASLHKVALAMHKKVYAGVPSEADQRSDHSRLSRG